MNPPKRHVLVTVEHTGNPVAELHKQVAIRAYPLPGVLNTEGWQVPQAMADVWTERQRQIDMGYGEAHDDSEDISALLGIVLDQLPAAADLIHGGTCRPVTRDECVKGAAVLLAMVEKMDREAQA